MQGPIETLIAQCRPGWSLERDFYSDVEVYRREMDRIWRPGWLFAGHGCEIPRAGDYFTLDAIRTELRGYKATPELYFWNVWLAPKK